MDNILTRRSIRKFVDKPVSDEDIESILRAAMASPSAGNMQPWEFLVIKDRKILDKVPEIHQYAKMALESPIAIVVCCDTSKKVREGFWIQDCSAASQNILLAAHALGLGAVWCGIYPNEERTKAFQELLKMPSDVYPVNIIPIGHPAEEKEPSDRYTEEKIHIDKW
ncbi:MAG: nitroreductase family protein [Candidatus Heimdallarchaeota archaeon]|nr:nitroreductase family protein [Candidatus Heimdallarchaeota archaeon]MCK4878397.1 nitroreductase family protein [Candidatus Heimdallarchaeota archaeon]